MAAYGRRAFGAERPPGIDHDDAGNRSATSAHRLGTREQLHLLHIATGDPAQIGPAAEGIVYREPIHQDQDLVGATAAELGGGRPATAGAPHHESLPAIESATEIASPLDQALARDGDAVRTRDYGDAV